MREYKVAFKTGAEKEHLALPGVIASRIILRIEVLAANPRPRGVKKLRGATDLWRTRAGDYRVVYAIDNRKGTVTVMRVAHRREVYE